MLAAAKFAHLWDEDGDETVNKTNNPPLTSDQDATDFAELFSSFGFEPINVGSSGGESSSSAAERTLSTSSSSSWNSSGPSSGMGAKYFGVSPGSSGTQGHDSGDSGYEKSGSSSNDSAFGNSLTGLDAPLIATIPQLKFGTDVKKLSKYLNTVPDPPEQLTYANIVATLTEVTDLLAENTKTEQQTILSSIWSPVPKPQMMNQDTTKQCMQMVKAIQEAVRAGKVKDYVDRIKPKPHRAHAMHQLQHDSAPARCFSIENGNLEQAAKFHRENAGISSTNFIWRGRLPRRTYRNVVFSCKVFLGGLPYDMSEAAMIQSFRPFGNARIEWPGKDNGPAQHKGYAYAIFENEKQVKMLLQNCFHDYTQDGRWFWRMCSRRVRMQNVEVIPWSLCDSDYTLCENKKIDSRTTIFVGALHGMLNAEGLCTVMNDLFGGVVSAGIDTDRHKYPIGSGRVTFDNYQSYFKAIVAAFVEIKSTKFSKTVQVDPYLEDATCSVCTLQQAPYFCRDLTCFKYFCRTCFELAHMTPPLRSHRPLMRNSNKQNHPIGFTVPHNNMAPPPGFAGAGFVHGTQYGRNSYPRMPPPPPQSLYSYYGAQFGYNCPPPPARFFPR